MTSDPRHTEAAPSTPTAADKRSRTMFLKRVKAYTTPDGGYTTPTVTERPSTLGYDVVRGADLDAQHQATQRFHAEWEALSDTERAEALRAAHAQPAPETDVRECRHCGNPIRQIPVDEIPIPPHTRTIESAQARIEQVRTEVGDHVWITTESRRHTCASANFWHEPTD